MEGDRFVAFGSFSSYSLDYSDWRGGSAQDTIVKYQGDVIAVIEDDTSLDIHSDFDFV